MGVYPSIDSSVPGCLDSKVGHHFIRQSFGLSSISLLLATSRNVKKKIKKDLCALVFSYTYILATSKDMFLKIIYFSKNGFFMQCGILDWSLKW